MSPNYCLDFDLRSRETKTDRVKIYLVDLRGDQTQVHLIYTCVWYRKYIQTLGPGNKSERLKHILRSRGGVWLWVQNRTASHGDSTFWVYPERIDRGTRLEPEVLPFFYLFPCQKGTVGEKGSIGSMVVLKRQCPETPDRVRPQTHTSTSTRTSAQQSILHLPSHRSPSYRSSSPFPGH